MDPASEAERNENGEGDGVRIPVQERKPHPNADRTSVDWMAQNTVNARVDNAAFFRIINI